MHNGQWRRNNVHTKGSSRISSNVSPAREQSRAIVFDISPVLGYILCCNFARAIVFANGCCLRQTVAQYCISCCEPYPLLCICKREPNPEQSFNPDAFRYLSGPGILTRQTASIQAKWTGELYSMSHGLVNGSIPVIESGSRTNTGSWPPSSSRPDYPCMRIVADAARIASGTG